MSNWKANLFLFPIYQQKFYIKDSKTLEKISFDFFGS